MSIRKTIFLVSVSFVFLGASYFSYSRNIKNVDAQVTAPQSYLSGYAWSDTIGWISFMPDTGTGRYIEVGGDGSITGFAWSDNIGWIQFGGLSTSSMPASPKINATLTNGKLSGWARACAGTLTGDCTSDEAYPGGWDGWISLSGSALNSYNYGVYLQNGGSSGWLSDYAWGSNILGWISFFGKLSDNSTYGVQVVGTNCGVDNSTITKASPITAGNSWQDAGLIGGTLDASSQDLFGLYGMTYDSNTGTISTSASTPTFDNPKITIHLTFDAPTNSPAGCPSTYLRDATFSVYNALIPQPTTTSESKIKLSLCKGTKCVDANGGMSISSSSSVKISWIIGGGKDTACTGSSELSIPSSLPGPDYIVSGETAISPITSTKVFSIRCSGGGKSETKTVKAVILNVREF